MPLASSYKRGSTTQSLFQPTLADHVCGDGGGTIHFTVMPLFLSAVVVRYCLGWAEKENEEVYRGITVWGTPLKSLGRYAASIFYGVRILTVEVSTPRCRFIATYRTQVVCNSFELEWCSNSILSVWATLSSHPFAQLGGYSPRRGVQYLWQLPTFLCTSISTTATLAQFWYTRCIFFVLFLLVRTSEVQVLTTFILRAKATNIGWIVSFFFEQTLP